MDDLSRIRSYNTRKAWPDPQKTALLVVDMQRTFLWAAEKILPNVHILLDRCRALDIPVVFTRHGHKDPSRDGGMLAVWWDRLPQYGSSEWELIDSLSPGPEEVIIDKMRYSAFVNSPLHQILRGKGIQDLIITGVLTNCCCETTARDAFNLDYRVFFVADATAGPNEELHLATLMNLAYGFAYILTTEALQARLSRPSRPPRPEL